jgi:hypothetical protein
MEWQPVKKVLHQMGLEVETSDTASLLTWHTSSGQDSWLMRAITTATLHNIMRPPVFRLLIFCNLFFADTYGQEIIGSTCDSIILSKQEYEKCKADTAWNGDIVIKTNYIIRFKTELLPKYRIIRKGLTIPVTLEKLVRQLSMTYDTVLNKKLAVFQTEMDRNQKYIQPKAYLSSVLSFQIFKFYPDVYAVLLNNIHLQLSPKTTAEELKSYKGLFDEIIKSIPADLYHHLVKVTNDMETEKSELNKKGFMPLFRGSIEEGYRSQCNIVNFLLWIR